MSRLIAWLEALPERFTAWAVHHARLLRDPESMAGWFIVTVWMVLAGAWGGWVGILVFVGIGWLLHAAAVESGNHVALWFATALLLVAVVVASATMFDGLPPVLLAAAGATVLAHNELVRLNYTRRRRAMIDDEVFHASGLAMTISGVVGVVGVAVADAMAQGVGRNWLWMPAAIGALMAIGLALAVLPARRAPEASRQRWRPGERIPPQPLARDESEHF